MNESASAVDFYQKMFGGAWITQGLWVAAELGIADLLADGPRDVDELAAKTGADSEALSRVLRALASVGVFAKNGDRQFHLTPLAELLRTDAAMGQGPLAALMGAEFNTAWGQLLYSAQTGDQGFRKAFGVPFFEYMLDHPERHALYDQAMTGVHGPETQPVLDAYDLSGFRTIVDIGGGNGSVLIDTLRRYPNLHGIVFDLPAVAERTQSALAAAGLSDRCEAVGGDFFVAVPDGVDVYFLRHVLHDWQDDEAIEILRRCREAMDPEARVLVVETVIPEGNEPCFGKWLDLMMLVVGGRERTEREYRALFEAAGLKLARVVPTAAEVSVVEGVLA